MTVSYDWLEARFARLGALSEASGMLHWDLSVMMPSGGGEARAEQLASLSVLCHELLSERAVAEQLDAAEAAGGLDTWQAANLVEMRRSWRHETALDARFVEAYSKACHACEAVWREARPKADFGLVLPHLEEVVRLVREEAARKAEAFGCTPYEALLDSYEPGGSEAEIDSLFDRLAKELPGLLRDARERQARQAVPLVPEGPFPIAAQEQLGRRLMVLAGFDFAHGRLDVSLHPFSGGTPDDVRVTTRYEENDFTSSLMGVMHETGHALYERGLPARWRRQPVGESRGMGIHESQSLLMEMQACRSPEFLAFLSRFSAAAFGRSGPAWTADNFRRLYHWVQPGCIRVEADEVSYPLHVILRTRLEKAILTDDLQLRDLPGAWNDGMQAFLGLTPPDDRLGCLQDIHWYDGAWGYFPTYTLGAMIAAQLFQAALSAAPEIPGQLARGDFSSLQAWLRRTVHEKASSRFSHVLIEEASGKPLDPAVFMTHLRRRYLGADAA
ncbi:MAG: carboxypeptidase M32 [Rhodospirillales bacterium]|nr:carboxypeptidase M32 [Rhodospirillales bacterium]